MPTSRDAHAITEKLNTVLFQVEPAAHAHAQLAHSQAAIFEIKSIVEELSALAQSETHAPAQCASFCPYHEQLDALLQRADRLLQSDRQSVADSLRSYRPIEPSARYETYSNLAVVESFIASAKATAYQLLARPAETDRTDGFRSTLAF